MRIATLQFSPSLGAVQHNIDRANTLLSNLRDTPLDLLVLPELAFSGYNFPSLEAIKPYLEPTTAGTTSEWAMATAKLLHCHVIVGYPEIHTDRTTGQSTNYNSTVTVSPTGEILMNYRKSFLYYTDETWAREGPNGSAREHTSLNRPFFCGPLGKLGMTGHGICMDINPYRFLAPWTDYEFANAVLTSGVRLVVLSMAWLTRLLPEDLQREPRRPDMETVAYWLERFFPLIESKPSEEIIVVFANRCGTEGNRVGSFHIENGEEVEMGNQVCYAGSSCVMKFQGGMVSMFDKADGPAMVGKGEEGVLLVDTAQVRLHFQFVFSARQLTALSLQNTHCSRDESLRYRAVSLPSMRGCTFWVDRYEIIKPGV